MKREYLQLLNGRGVWHLPKHDGSQPLCFFANRGLKIHLQAACVQEQPPLKFCARCRRLSNPKAMKAIFRKIAIRYWKREEWVG